MSLIAYLRSECRLPIRVIRELLIAQYSVEVSIGEIARILRRVAKCGKPAVEKLLTEVRSAPFVHADETGWREDGKNGYLWSFSTPDTRYYVRAGSRGSDIAKTALGDDFNSILISDFYSAYSFYAGEHQRCWVHFLRDLRELKQKHPDDKSVRKFVRNIRAVFDHAKKSEHADARVRRRRRFAYQDRLMRIATPFLNGSQPQRVLAERIERFITQLFVFVEYPGTPSDNNAAERAIRPAVIARKISGGTRSDKGSDTMSALYSLFGTWKVRGHDALACCRKLLCGTLESTGNPA
jgi:hypothetical protein